MTAPSEPLREPVDAGEMSPADFAAAYRARYGLRIPMRGPDAEFLALIRNYARQLQNHPGTAAHVESLDHVLGYVALLHDECKALRAALSTGSEPQ